MRKTLTMLAAVVGALVIALLASSPAQATDGTWLQIFVNEDNGRATFEGDMATDGEWVKACDTKADGYDIVSYIDSDRDGDADYWARSTGGNGSCSELEFFNVPEERRMYFWACQVKPGSLINCTSKYTVYA